MFNNLVDALAYIENKRQKRTLEQFKETISKYHINTDLKNIIHVAGTNGKGSTVKFIKDILIAHGKSVGTFTSPYIIKHNDRIGVNNEYISDKDLLDLINELQPIIEEEQLSMFEIDTLIMFKYFSKLDLDYHIIETGIGGLNDKTNVVTSKISVITNIGYDHCFMLGDTLDKIARHKAGIIKENQVLVTSESNKDILKIFKDTCDSLNTKMIVVDSKEITSYPYIVEFDNRDYVLYDCGSYQVSNLKLALSVVSELIDIDSQKVQQAINNFNFPGRFEKIKGIYLDGAHNQSGIEALLKTIKDQQLTDCIIIFSALKDKETKTMLDMLKQYPVIKAKFDDDRLAFGDALDYKEALRKASKHKNIIVTGSLHFVSEVRRYLLEI